MLEQLLEVPIECIRVRDYVYIPGLNKLAKITKVEEYHLYEAEVMIADESYTYVWYYPDQRTLIKLIRVNTKGLT